MQHKNKKKHMERSSYLIWHVCGTTIITALFKGTSLYRSLYGSEYVDMIVIWLLAAACCMFGVMVTWRSRRRRELCLNIIAPTMIWIAVTWIVTIPFPVVCAAASVPIIQIALSRGVYANYAPKTKSLRAQLILFLRKCRRAGVGAIAVLVLFLGIRGYFFSPTVQFPRASEREQVTIETSLDSLKLFEPSRWISLNQNQKLAACQIVADIEADAFGLPERLIVKAEKLSRNTCAEYSHFKRQVTIDKRYLDAETPDEVLRSILHECRHAYQHQLISLYESADDRQKDLMIFRETDVSAIKDSFDSYVDGDQDYDRYFHQRCEEDSREWAATQSIVYFNAIKYYLQQQEGG